MRTIKIISVFFILIFTGCNQKSDAPRKIPRNLPAGDVKITKVVISLDEYLTIMDIPDNFIGKRCWVYVNDKIKSSHMKCDDDFISTSTEK